MTGQQVGVDADGFPVFGTVIDGIVIPDGAEFRYAGNETPLTVPPPRWPAGVVPVIVVDRR